MSNLKLPVLTFENLSAKLPQNGANRIIGYATTAHRFNNHIVVSHHGTPIASFGSQDGVEFVSLLTSYSSSTTVARQHKVLKDNDIWQGVAIRQGEAHIVSHRTDDNGKWREKKEPLPYYGATWTHNGTGWDRHALPLDSAS